MIKIALWILSASSLIAEVYQANITPSDINSRYGSIKILDQKEILLDKISNLPFSEISDIAYDRKKKILYMVGDKGYIYQFRAIFSDKIELLEPLSAYMLTKEKGKKFNKKVDSEGLTLDKNDNLIISFERRPKIETFSAKGHRIKKHKLPSKISNRKNYRNGNKMLESVANHPKYGIITASELPLKKNNMKLQSIYSLSVKKWNFEAEADKKSSVTAIEIMDDDNILILERAYSGVLNPRVITLKKLLLGTKNKGLYKTEVLAKMSSADGWKVDNFEGLVRVAPRRYLMISDDNGNFFQKTLLVYFEVIE